MAPAGSYAALAAAIRNGADSVYFGIDRLNMRARSASPFRMGDLKRIARLCRWCGVRSYLALNVIVYDRELIEIREVCDAARAAGVSAVIAADIAVIEYARAIGLEVHISTQSNISNLGAVRFYSRYADVLVLARELTLDQIAAINDAIAEEGIRGPSGELVRTELFVHGALCVAVSGQCHMSLAQYNASGNRGACYQSCRRRYRVTDAETGEEFVLENQFVMSPKDLCTVGQLDRIVRAGVRVLKIEGRGRSADYVARTTRIYRDALDDFLAQEAERPGAEWPAPEKREGWVRELEEVFNRGFWEGGYYCGETPAEWADVRGSQAREMRVQLGRVSNYFARSGVMEFKSCQPELKRGTRILVLGHTTGVVEFDAESLRVEGQPVEQAGMHAVVTVPVPVKVRRGDKVFELVDRGCSSV